jgi:hypothetical protein
MRRRALAGFLAVLAVGLIAVAAVGLTRGSGLVYSLGVSAAGPAVAVAPGGVACQTPISVPDGAAFDRVGVTLSTYEQPGSELMVEVRSVDGDRRLATGTLPAGYRDGPHVVEVGRVATRAPLAVCLRNTGSGPLAVYGQPTIASPRTNATLDGKKLGIDMAITLNREQRSFIALLPTMAERASLFRAGWVGPFTYLVLALLVVIGAPLLLARAMAAAARADDDEPSAERREDEPPVAAEEPAEEARPAGAAQER